MNKLLKSILYMFSIIFTQVLLSKTIEYRGDTYSLLPEVKRFMAKAVPQKTSQNTIMVDNSHYDSIVVVLFEGKLKIYHWHSMPEYQMSKDFLNNVNKEYFICYKDSNNSIFCNPEINFKGLYFMNAQYCFINAANSIVIDESIIESPNIILKANEINITSFLIDVDTIELHSNNANSFLFKIKFTLKDKSDFDCSMIAGDIDFNNNFIILTCLGVSKIELQCSDIFEINEKAIYFNKKH